MRNRFLSLALIFLAGCASQQTPVPAPPVAPAEPVGISIEEEAAILRLEDRREFDAAVVESWIRHTNPLHRARIALALGRIGPATFIDKDGDGERDAEERMAGVELLTSLVSDHDFNVRRNAAFALGEIGDPAGMEALFAFSRDPDHADVAAEAVEALSKMATVVLLDRYAQLTTDEREGIRARALRHLYRFNSDDASAIATRFLDDSNTDVKREAVYALARRAYAPARSRLELLLGDTDTLTRAHAARALGLIGAAESLAPLIASLGDIHPWVRTNSARAIAQIAEKAPSAIVTAHFPEQLSHVIALTSDPDPGTRAAAIDTLGYYAEHSDAARRRLLEIAASGSPWTRELATGAVAKHLAEDPSTQLQSLFETDSRWAKIRVLEATGAQRTVGPPLRIRLYADPDSSVRAAAINAIPEAAVDRELDLIKKALEDADPVVRSAAIDRYSAQKTDPLWQVLERLRQAEERARTDSLNDARLSAIQALGKLEYPEREAFLRERLRDRDPVVRRVAAELIEQQLRKPRPQYTPLAIDRPFSEYLDVARWARDPHTATIQTSRGKIELVLLTLEAPITARNFSDLASRGFFNGTSFMRVVPNFVIQGGDPRNDMSGGPGYAIRDEINLQKYTRGAVGMALSGPDTGGSQFFITHSPQPHLDGGYTIFGRVIGGMTGVVDQTERGDRIESIAIDQNKPAQPNQQQSAVSRQ